HVFVHDRVTQQTRLASVASDGTPGNSYSFQPALSADGRYVAFYSFATNLSTDGNGPAADIFVHDLVTGETRQVSVATDGTPANDSSSNPGLSADGRYVTFTSSATNLVPGNTNRSVSG